MVFVVGAIGYWLAVLVSCEKTTNPLPITGYWLTISAHPDSIPNTGSVSSIHAIVRDLVDSSQVGGLHLEFSASAGYVTGIGTSSADDSTGLIPPYVYYSCQSCPDTITVVTIRGSAFDNGDFVDSNSTHVTVFVP